MTPEERVQLSRFLQLLEQARTGPKDEAAEAVIAESFKRQPDAAYLLVQRVMQLEFAEQASQAEFARLRQQLAAAPTAGLPPSFFGANAGANAWGRQSQATAPAPVPAASHAQQAPQSTWGSGLMGTLAMTAGGVVAGSLIAQGIGSLMGHRNEAHAADNTAIPPGAGTLVETDYGASPADADGGYVADDFDPGDSGAA